MPIKIPAATGLAYDCNHMRSKPRPAADRAAQPKSRPHTETAFAGVTPTERKVATGTALFRQDDTAFGVFRLVAGRIRLVRVTPDGVRTTMHVARPGELFAEAALFSERYHCDAVAETDSVVQVYPKADLARYLKNDPRSLWAFTAELARRMQSLRARLELRQIRSAPQRVLQFLRLRCDKDGVLRVDGSLKHLAEEIGLTHEALYRALAALRQDGAIDRRPGELRLRRGMRARKMYR